MFSTNYINFLREKEENNRGNLIVLKLLAQLLYLKDIV